MHLVLALLGALRAALGARTDLVPENLALRQQLALLRRRSKRPRFGPLDRLFWIWLSQRWARWRETLNVVLRDRDSLAQAGLPRILELEVPARPNRETARRLRGRKARPHHGPRQSPRRRDRQASLLREPGRV